MFWNKRMVFENEYRRVRVNYNTIFCDYCTCTNIAINVWSSFRYLILCPQCNRYRVTNVYLDCCCCFHKKTTTTSAPDHYVRLLSNCTIIPRVNFSYFLQAPFMKIWMETSASFGRNCRWYPAKLFDYFPWHLSQMNCSLLLALSLFVGARQNPWMLLTLRTSGF